MIDDIRAQFDGEAMAQAMQQVKAGYRGQLSQLIVEYDIQPDARPQLEVQIRELARRVAAVDKQLAKAAAKK